MGLTVAECDTMTAAAQKANRILMVAHVLRFWPEYVALAEVIQSGELGKPLTATAIRLCAAAGLERMVQPSRVDGRRGIGPPYSRSGHVQLALWHACQPLLAGAAGRIWRLGRRADGAGLQRRGLFCRGQRAHAQQLSFHHGAAGRMRAGRGRVRAAGRRRTSGFGGRRRFEPHGIIKRAKRRTSCLSWLGMVTTTNAPLSSNVCAQGSNPPKARLPRPGWRCRQHWQRGNRSGRASKSLSDRLFDEPPRRLEGTKEHKENA